MSHSRSFARRGRPLVLLSFLSALACGDANTAPTTGQLAVTIDGLPVGIKPAVLVSGPDSFRQLLDSSRTLAALTPGTYTIFAPPLIAGDARYAATPSTQTVTVGAALSSASPISYRVSSAKLNVIVVGLPSGTSASVTLTGPSGYTKTLTTTTQLDLLEPGTYTIAASTVQAAGKSYRAVRTSYQVELSEFVPEATTTIEYGAGSGGLGVTITALPGNADASVTIAGPGGFMRRLTSSTILGNLEAGTYTIIADVVTGALVTHTPAPASQTVVVTDGASSAATVTYVSTPLQLSLRLVADGFTQPVFLTAPDGDARLFLVERGGRIRIIANGAVLSTPFLDIRARVNNIGERGMLSMAFDPQYAANGIFYVYYVDLAGSVVVERIMSTPGSNIAGGSGGIVMTIPHGGSEHHGGLIAFGPDGMLYVAPGDGGCCGDPNNNAQNLGNLLGKILRIDVRSLPYTIPAGNPYVGQSGLRPEIWAHGLRNPWRYSFDVPSGMLYIGDVGQDLREELDVSRITDAGVNYGWRFMEGLACFNPSTNCSAANSFKLPVLDYVHASDACSIIGGYVYRGSAMPELTGYYLYSDYCGGWLRSVRVSGGFANELTTWASIKLTAPVSFGRDSGGELYLIAGTAVWILAKQ